LGFVRRRETGSKYEGMTARELAEYKALRDTIRERGTARMWLQLATFIAWAAITIATAALAPWPIATLVPLLVLAAGFETGFALHTGVERVGRYIQVFFEGEDADRGWEHRIMAYGAGIRAPASDPLLVLHFWTATVLNFVPALLANLAPSEWIVVGVLHLLFMARIGAARRHATRQRAIDLERFRQLKGTA